MRCDPDLAIWAALQPSEQVVCSAKGYRDAWKGTEAMCSWRKGLLQEANYASGIPNLIYDLTHWKRGLLQLQRLWCAGIHSSLQISHQGDARIEQRCLFRT